MQLNWKPWAGGLVLGGFVGADPLVGICGPHPNGRYSLTFYRTPVERRLELFFWSVEHAQAKAEFVLGIWERRDRERQTRPHPTQPPQGLAPT